MSGMMVRWEELQCHMVAVLCTPGDKTIQCFLRGRLAQCCPDHETSLQLERELHSERATTGTLMARVHQSLIICYACHEHLGPMSFPVWY